MKEFPRKFLSLRDKNGIHNRSKSVPPGSKQNRPLSAEAFKSIFKSDQSKQAAQVESEAVKEAVKIEEIQQRLDKLNITNVTVDHIRDIMATLYAEGDPARTAEFIDIEQKALAGVISSYDPGVELVGAENRGAVTCYLDSLLFAMFAKLDAFECMLKTDFPPEDPKSKLVNLLRIWVNMLRRGKLIRTDLTEFLQDSLAECGWPDARMLEQQDTSEAFAFLTETLQLPLLSLQVDLFHQGKRDDDDHKIVYERLLNLAVPPDPDGKGIKLEDCLEEYFNAQVDVLRDSEVGKKSMSEDKTSENLHSFVNRSTIRLIRGEESMSSATMAASPVEITPTTSLLGPSVWKDSILSSQMSDLSRSVSHNDAVDRSRQHLSESPSSSQAPPLKTRQRSTSVIQRVVLDDQGRLAGSEDSVMAKRARRKGSTVVKAITIPAWQFFRLIPWHSANSQEPRNNSEVATNFDQRPVVGICLKRYAMTESGLPKRHNTFIDIPDSLRLPHFMLADGPTMEEDSHGLNTEYKLVLQSIVCHRGDSLQSGHYVAFARVAPKLLTDNRRHDFDPPPDYEEAQWVKFDDLNLENRVSFVDDIRESLKFEMPYLLFYQVVPMVDAACPSSEGTEIEPPSYNEARVSIEIPRIGTSDGPSAGQGHGLETCFEDPTIAEINRLGHSKPPSIRLSAEVDRPSRSFLQGLGFGSNNDAGPGGSRRQSVTFSDSANSAVTPAITPDAQSPVITPIDEPTTASRLSRAASRFTLGRQSRPVSQSGEGRLSSTMTRLGFIKPSKEPLADPNALTVSTTIAIGELGAESRKSTSLESPMEEKTEHQTPHTPKPKHKRVKSKEKNEKHKTGGQPERECTVM
ncbi:hypothetical protein PT974_06793 [Cladobotryum mycophilum]|uniref:ubiquitinyl hydrolase 1 n=1 Tax=Cladobotryum mycophilum TaxID=491253 RepID=A0ABR0SMP2_9HYPO